MKIRSISLENFKRFNNLCINNIPIEAKLVILTGPNGSGKSSLFEGFNFWSRYKRGQGGYDGSYHAIDNSLSEHSMRESVKIDFHDYNPNGDYTKNKQSFYIRSAYRYGADFTSNGIGNLEDPLDSNNKLNTLINQESRISENYNRIVGEAVNELFNGLEPDKTKLQIRDHLIGEVRDSMLSIFGDLTLSGTGRPTSNGTFRFSKGDVKDFHFKNLSGGEKAAFDLLLDFIVKKQSFNNTIFCIDEPELHMHTRLQGKLLECLYSKLPDNCQLWISTHSIGMARKAAELERLNPGEVVFIDFHDQNFEEKIEIYPTKPTRLLWKNMFKTALDDLSELVIPNRIIFCEGKKLGETGTKPTFDATIYNEIFASKYPDTEFIPLGGHQEVEANTEMQFHIFRTLAPGTMISLVVDRDDRSEEEVSNYKKRGYKVLTERDLENYLWSDEILIKLSKSSGQEDKAEIILNKKTELLKGLSNGKPYDDVKAITGELYNFCKETLSIVKGGNNREAFAISVLSKLITPETETYKKLESIIFS